MASHGSLPSHSSSDCSPLVPTVSGMIYPAVIGLEHVQQGVAPGALLRGALVVVVVGDEVLALRAVGRHGPEDAVGVQEAVGAALLLVVGVLRPGRARVALDDAPVGGLAAGDQRAAPLARVAGREGPRVGLRAGRDGGADASGGGRVGGDGGAGAGGARPGGAEDGGG